MIGGCNPFSIIAHVRCDNHNQIKIMLQSITAWLSNSSYGKLTTIIRQVFNTEDVAEDARARVNDASTFNLSSIRLSRIIVVGTESSGKSTLMQRVTSRKYFPQNFELGTKCPIILRLFVSPTSSYSLTWREETFQLKNDQAIAKKVKEIMDALECHVEDELIIEIKGPDLPNFELIDLPGLIAVPGPAADRTKQLVHKYMSNPDTLVLCVVSAGTERLNSNLAVAKVIEMRKQKETILCLTKCDSVNAEYFDPLVIKRVMMANEMRELDGTPFAGVVATASLNKDDVTKEKEFFQKMLKTISTDNPLLYDVLPKMNSENIIRILDDLYHGYITKTWCPNVLERIQAMIHQENAALAALGKPASEIDSHIVWQEARQHFQVRVFSMVTNAAKDSLQSTRAKLMPEPDTENIEYQWIRDNISARIDVRSVMSPQQVVTIQHFLSILDEMSADLSLALIAAKATSDKAATLTEETSDYNIPHWIVTAMTAGLSDIFSEQENDELKIARFQYLLSLLHEELRTQADKIQFKTKNINSLQAKIQRSKLDLSSVSAGQAPKSPLELFEEIVGHAIMIYQVEANRLLSALDSYVMMELKGNEEVLIESTEIAEKRSGMLKRIAKLQEKCRNIEQLEEFQLSKKQDTPTIVESTKKKSPLKKNGK